MVSTVALRVIDTAWSIVCATHDRVDAAESSRCMLERHLQVRARKEEAEGLASFGLAYLALLPEDEC